MGDLRPFYKVDVGYFDNPKIADFLEHDPRVPILHHRAIAYCRQHLTDGAFPHARVARLACATYCGSECESQCDVCKATHAGLFDRIDDRQSYVHDYLEHQQSAEQAGKRKAAGRKAAAARWQARDNEDRDAKGNANRIPTSNADRNAEKRREELSGEIRPDVEALCILLADLIEGNGSKRPRITKVWHNSARLLLDKDGRDVGEATRLIRWCQADPFWHSNILSMPTFREKYDQLRLKANSPLSVVNGSRHVERTDLPEAWR